jgi:SAM-dependent methyltransferase
MDYRELVLLRAARETGVLDALVSSADTPEAVAAETGVTERAADVTVRALADLGFLERVGDGYEPTNRLLGFLTTTDVRSIGSLPFQLDCLERWIDLPETMRTGEPPEPPENWTAHYMGSMRATDDATVRAAVTAAVHAAPDAGRVLDVGGGPGKFAEEFARRGFDATLLDRPAVVETVEPLLAASPVALVAGDALDGLPGGFDLVFVSRVAQALGPEEVRQLLRNARDALEPGGTVVLVEYLRGESAGAAIFAAHMLAQTANGDVHRRADYREWLADAGFEGFEVEPIPGTELHAVYGSSRAIE